MIMVMIVAAAACFAVFVIVVAHEITSL
jgi:hypothetical protein